MGRGLGQRLGLPRPHRPPGAQPEGLPGPPPTPHLCRLQPCLPEVSASPSPRLWAALACRRVEDKAARPLAGRRPVGGRVCGQSGRAHHIHCLPESLPPATSMRMCSRAPGLTRAGDQASGTRTSERPDPKHRRQVQPGLGAGRALSSQWHYPRRGSGCSWRVLTWVWTPGGGQLGLCPGCDGRRNSNQSSLTWGHPWC